MTDIDETLAQRGNRYGVFKGHAEVTQRLKRVLAEELAKRDKVLDDDMQEALEMVFHKVGRIVNGDQFYDDSWIDISGYSKLVADRLTSLVSTAHKTEGT